MSVPSHEDASPEHPLYTKFVSEWDEQDRAAVMADLQARDVRRMQLEKDFSQPERISNADALAAAATAHVPPKGGGLYPDPDDWIVAHIYRDNVAADGWLASNTEHHGHTELLRVPLPDGRVILIMDLRESYRKAVAEAERKVKGMLGHNPAGNDRFA